MTEFFKGWISSKKSFFELFLDLFLLLGTFVLVLLIYFWLFELLSRTSPVLGNAFHATCIFVLTWCLATKYYEEKVTAPQIMNVNIVKNNDAGGTFNDEDKITKEADDGQGEQQLY